MDATDRLSQQNAHIELHDFISLLLFAERHRVRHQHLVQRRFLDSIDRWPREQPVRDKRNHLRRAVVLQLLRRRAERALWLSARELTAVSTISSIIMHVLPSTVPTRSMRSICEAPERILMIIAKFVFTLLPSMITWNFLARCTPPASGDTTVRLSVYYLPNLLTR